MHAKHQSEKENISEVCNSQENLKVPSYKSRQTSNSLSQIISFTSLNQQPLSTKATKPAKISEAAKPNSISFHSNTARFTNPLQSVSQNTSRQIERKPKLYTLASKPISPQKVKRMQTNESVILGDDVEVRPTETTRLIKEYSQDILSYLQIQQKVPLNFLRRHEISTHLRAKMIDWMVEVLTSYHCRDQTFFLAVQMMDHFLAVTEKIYNPADLHLLGVAAMFLACKYEEIYPVKLQVVHEKIAHRKLSRDDIKQKEAEILHTLKFEIIYVTVYEIMTQLHSKLMLAFRVPVKVQTYVMKTLLYLAKMVMYDYELLSDLNEGMLVLAGGILTVGIKIVEQVETTLMSQSEDMTSLISFYVKQSPESLMETANKILKTAKNFEKMFPNLENLKKFHKFTFDDC